MVTDIVIVLCFEGSSHIGLGAATGWRESVATVRPLADVQLVNRC